MTTGAPQQQWIGSTVLGRYRVVRILAVGGMGAVYLGRAEGARGFVRPVVIKRILATYSDDEEAVAMFVREARILSQLQDPGIVSVLDFGQEDDTLVMVLEYVHGYHLGYWHAFTQRTSGKMDVEIATFIVTRVLDALSHAHNFVHPDGRKVQVVHRDISPSNVLLDIHGNVKLVDFGIARSQGEENDEYKTQAPRLKGKFSYMPVELFRGEEPSVQTDLYACGVMLYELLSGSNPFRGRTMAESYDKVRTVTPITLGALRDDISPELDATIAKGMAQDPALRFASALEFANALRAARTSSDETLRAELRTLLADAYAGPLSDVLEIEPLSSRNVAWQDNGDGDHEPVLDIVNDPSSGDGEAATVIVTSPPKLAFDNTLSSPPTGLAQDGATVNVPAPAQLIDQSRRGDSGRVWFLASVGVVLLAAAVAFAFWIGRKQHSGEDRVVVIERQTSPASVATATAQTTPSEVAPITETEPAPSATVTPNGTQPQTQAPALPTAKVHKPRDASATDGPDPRNLTRAFSKQQGKVERCFAQFPDQLGNESVSIKFQITDKGVVQSADLSPATIGDTPLGRCLVGVAKAATFPAQREAIAFRIPITARRVQ